MNFSVILVHQFEECRYADGEPWILNEVFHPKGEPVDRHPLTRINATFINVLAWSFYLVPVFLPGLVRLRPVPVLFGFSQFVVHGITTTIELKSFYNPGLAAVVLGHAPLSICYLAQAHQQGFITGWDWLFLVLNMAFFMGAIMMRIGHGLMPPSGAAHPFNAAETARRGRERRLHRAGIPRRDPGGSGS